MPVHINCIAEVFKCIEGNTDRKDQLQGFYVPISKIINKLYKEVGVLKIEKQA